jgi:lipoprotein-anchoring transpeptidase ErfK/SrfK
MNRFLSVSRRLPAYLLLAGTFAACTNNTSNNNTVNTKTTAAAGDSVATVMTPQASIDPGLTLPVLDALFYEEGFSDELKSKLALTDAEVTKIKNVAHSSVSDLDEKGDGTAYLGSAREASKRSESQLTEILGAEKAAQLRQFVADRYAGGDLAALLPTEPNSVPKDTRIVVNAPAYRMDVYQEGKLLRTYKVGIGYPEFPLPAGMRRADQIIFNPTWTPPDEPWVKGKFAPGKTVAAGSKDNPLGPIKIPIGLPSLIHGGKQPAKLGSFASHGCVGLTNEGVQDFAATLSQLGGDGAFTLDSVKSYAENRSKTKTEKLPKPIPVELRYETIVASNGNVTVYRDVYERGTNTVANADKVLAVYGLKFASLPEAEKSALYAALNEMNEDPKGNRIVENIGDPMSTETDSSKNSKPAKGRVTTTVKGRKEIVVPIAALSGKGYPAPVNLVGGTPQQTVADAR